jgi:hypothetical protein
MLATVGNRKTQQLVVRNLITCASKIVKNQSRFILKNKNFACFHKIHFCKSKEDPTKNLVSKSWIESKYVPIAFRPYLHLARADKQVGTLLLMWPCFWYLFNKTK